MSIDYGNNNVTTSGNIIAATGNFTGLSINNVSVSTSGHSHSSSDITNFNSGVSGLVSGIYATLDSPSLTGTPLVPTAPSGTNTNQIASTAFVRTEVSNLIASSPSALDTLNELASALGNDANFSTTVTNSLAGKANLSGATFTGLISSPSGSFDSLQVNGTGVSVNGHSHTASAISDFNIVASGAAPVQSVAGRIGTVTLIKSDIGLGSVDNTSDANKPISSATQTALDSKAALSHTHGNITNAGAVGSTANLPLITTTAGAITVGSFGTAANSFCQGNDSRLSDSRTPLSHTHVSADITNFNSSVSGLVSGVYAPLAGATFSGPVVISSSLDARAIKSAYYIGTLFN